MHTSRRDFLSFGTGLVALGVAPPATPAWSRWLDAGDALDFGPLEALAARMQDEEPDALLPYLAAELRAGRTLEQLAAAGALANARTHGGTNYNGYHAFMALVPALAMARLSPAGEGALPVLKVLHRNTRFIRDAGGRANERLQSVEARVPLSAKWGGDRAAAIQEAARAGRQAEAEALLAGSASLGVERAYADLQPVVRDEVDVHQVVLAWRVWETRTLVGEEHASTLLRTSLRHSVDRQAGRESRGVEAPAIRALLPELLESLPREPGVRVPSDAELESLASELYFASRPDGARAMAAALAAGFEPLALGEALALVGNRLVLCDPGRAGDQVRPGKPEGSVHGASYGVHGSDSARAWRHIAGALAERERAATLIAGAFHLAGDGTRVGGDDFPWRDALEELGEADGEAAASALDEALEAGDQPRAVAAIDRAHDEGVPTERLLGRCLAFATPVDGALHAEKYFLTVVEDLDDGRDAFRARHLRALARVTASEQGFPADGFELARELVGC